MSSLPPTLLQTLSSHTAPVNALTFSSLGGTYVLSGSSDRSVHLTRTEPTSPDTSNSPIQKYQAHGYPVLDIAVSSDNQTFASVGGDRSVFLWDVQKNEGTSRRFGSNTNQGHTSRINCVTFAGSDDAVLLSGSDDRSVRLWDVKSRDARPLMVLEEAKDGVSAVVAPGNGYEFVTGSTDGRVRSYDVRMGRVTNDVMPGSVTSIEVTRDSKCLLVGCLDGKLKLIDRNDGVCLRTFPGEGETNGYKNEALRLKSCLARNESLVVSGSEADGNVKSWDVVNGILVDDIQVSSTSKVVSVVSWREASKAQARQGVWAAGGVDGTVKIYGGD